MYFGSLQIYVVILMGLQAMGQEVKFEALNATGIIFSQITNVQLTYTEWRILYYYDISTYWEETGRINEYIKELQKICNVNIKNSTSENKKLCELIVKQFNDHLTAINHKENMFNAFQGKVSKKRKRAALEIVGTLANAIFGVLDADTGRQYTKDIVTLQNDANFQAELSKKQTMIVEGSIKLQNLTFNEIREKLGNLSNEIKKIGTLSKQASDEEWKIHFNSLAHITTLVLLHHNSLNNEVLKLLTHTVKGEMTDLIPPDQIKSSLIAIKEELQTDEQLPIDIGNDNIYRIFRVAAIHTMLSKDKILLELRVPIINNTAFKLFKSTQIPTLVGDSYAIIKPENEFFLTNPKQDIYIPMTRDEIKDCRQVSIDKAVCKQLASIYTNPGEICELALMKQSKYHKVPTQCKVERVPRKNYMIQMYDVNKYYCVINSPRAIQNVCGQNSQNFELTENGFITIQAGCYIVDGNTILKPHAMKNLKSAEVITPKFNLASLLEYEKPNQSLITEEKAIFIKNYHNEFDELSRTINEQINIGKYRSTIQRLEDKFSSTDNIFIIFIISIIIILFIFAIVKIFNPITFIKNIRSKKQASDEQEMDECEQERPTGSKPRTEVRDKDFNDAVHEEMLRQLSEFQKSCRT